MSQPRGETERGQVIAAVIGAIAVIVAAITSSPKNPSETIPTAVSAVASTDAPAQATTTVIQLIPTSTQQLPTSEPKYSGLIPFASPNDPSALNPSFRWQSGGSTGSSYDLKIHPGSLTIAADGKTVQWAGTNTAPLMLLPIRGNFETSVGLVFSPKQWDQVAGLGVRSSEDKNTYLRIIRFAAFPTGDGISVQGMKNGSPTPGNSIAYKGDQAYFKIQRQGNIFNLSYSTDGSSWEILDRDYVFGLPSEVQIFLLVYSTDSRGIVAQFSNFEAASK